MSNVRLVININASFMHQHPPKDMADTILRRQSNIAIQQIATKLNKPVAVMLEEIMKLVSQQGS